jgi:nicotinate-nucleotide pyrophosphorylase (carboxylating)
MIDSQIEDVVSRALAEDLGLRDVTTEALIEPGRRAHATIEQKAPGAIYGFDVVHAVFHRLDPLVEFRPLVTEGEWRKEVSAVVAELAGDARALLSGERVALNFLGHLSGIATYTASCVYALRGSPVTILDTRKTTPGLRLLEKRAVAAGGGRNHRMGLWDAILVKENHIALAGGVREAVRRALERRPLDCLVEVECRTLTEVEEALAAGAERLLLDNMDAAELRRAVELTGGRAELEASGSLKPETLRAVADAGVQFVSIGALTHSAPALDVSMIVREPA